jgi:transposase
MSIRPEDVPSDPARLVAMVRALDTENERLRAIVRTLKDLLFGARSERAAVIDVAQLPLDLDDLAVGPTPPPPPANDEGGTERKGDRPRRPAVRNIGALPKHLPRCEEVIEPETTICPCCSGALHRIGEETREALDVVPAFVRVKRTIIPKYACRTCEGAIVQAKSPPRLVEGGMATTALVTHVAVSKFAWHIPLYRQAQIFKGQGVRLDRSTLALWMKRAAWWLKPLYERQLAAILAGSRVFCDETPMPVLDPGRGQTKRGQFWSHAVDDRPWGGPAPPAVAYVYAEGRSMADLASQVHGFTGILQVDGYGSYKGLARRRPQIQLAFCLAHARRKFVAVHKATHAPLARDVIASLGEVYAIEARIRGRNATERRAVRQAETKPILDALKTRLMTALADLPSRSSLVEAIKYMLGHWAGLTVFLEDGRIEVDTNTVERTMRPIALGRKNALFAGSDSGARTWAILASLINTAKLNDLDPHTYLVDVLERMISGRTPVNRLDELLAWNWKAARDALATAAA